MLAFLGFGVVLVRYWRTKRSYMVEGGYQVFSSLLDILLGGLFLWKSHTYVCEEACLVLQHTEDVYMVCSALRRNLSSEILG